MLSRNNLKFRKDWDITKENFIGWVSNNSLKKFIQENCTIDNLSLWWATKLVSKDNVNFPDWFVDLKKVFCEKNYQVSQKSFFWLRFFFKFLYNLLKQILWTIFIKIFSFSRFRNYKFENCFHSYNYDFSLKDNEFYNKLYGKIYTNYNKKKNIHIISNIKKIFFLQNYLNFSKNDNLVILDEYVSLKEIIRINLIAITSLFRVLKFIKKNEKVFVIKKKNCKNILKPLLLNSFCGEIQTSILMALSVRNFLEDKEFKNFITYGEFTPMYRPTYFYVKKLRNKPKITTFQHGQGNSLFNFSKKEEFSLNSNLAGTEYSPSPDKYFVQGKNFYKNIKKFYRGTVKIIGSPRYDNIVFKRKKLKLDGVNRKKKNILVCTSVGDHEDILDLVSRSANNQHNYILSPHPDNKKKVFSLYENKFKSKVHFSILNNYSTAQLIQVSDLVITGLSHACIEAQLIGIPSIRVANPAKPDYLDHKDQIKVIYTSDELKKVLRKQNFKLYKIKKIKKLIKDYFLYLDNKAYKRFWKYI